MKSFLHTLFLAVPVWSLLQFCGYGDVVPSSMVLSSPVFAQGDSIPERFTCLGVDVNPPLKVEGVPSNARSLALIVHDPRGIVGEWVHWVVYNIRPEVMDISEDVSPGTEALNDFGNFRYGGPCPHDERLHEYIFTLYALDTYLTDVNEGATRDTFLKAVSGHIVAQATLRGVFQQPKWSSNDPS